MVTLSLWQSYNYTIIITGDEVCREEILESHSVTKSIIPNLTHNKSDVIKDNQEFSDEEHSPKVLLCIILQ